MSGRTHDVAISGFDLTRLESELSHARACIRRALAAIDQRNIYPADLVVARTTLRDALDIETCPRAGCTRPHAVNNQRSAVSDDSAAGADNEREAT